MEITAAHEAWPIAGTFRIARGARTSVDVVVVIVKHDGLTGRGECVPYPRYNESPEQTLALIRKTFAGTVRQPTRDALLTLMPAGAARNAIDCALWDIEARQTGMAVWETLGYAQPPTTATAVTLSLDTPEVMAAAAARYSQWPLLKLKLGGNDGMLDRDRLAAVRAAAPSSELIVDANEGWTIDYLELMVRHAVDAQVAMIEQPLPAAADAALTHFDSPIPIGADESVHDLLDLDEVASRYSVVNIKLDKTGGLTRALKLKDACDARGLSVMIGCMVATSLSIIPAMMLTKGARFVDLDGALLLARDRSPGLDYNSGRVTIPMGIWGDAACND